MKKVHLELASITRGLSLPHLPLQCKRPKQFYFTISDQKNKEIIILRMINLGPNQINYETPLRNSTFVEIIIFVLNFIIYFVII